MTKIKKKKKSIRGYQRCFVVTATEFRLRLTQQQQQQQWWNCVCFERRTHTHSHSRMQQLPSELSALADVWMYWLCEVAICIFFFWQPGVSVQTSSTPFDSIRFRIPHVSFFFRRTFWSPVRTFSIWALQIKPTWPLEGTFFTVGDTPSAGSGLGEKADVSIFREKLENKTLKICTVI